MEIFIAYKYVQFITHDIGCDNGLAFLKNCGLGILNCGLKKNRTMDWLELLTKSGIMKKELLNDLIKESNDLTAIFTSSGYTAKSKLNNSQSKIRNPQ